MPTTKPPPPLTARQGEFLRAIVAHLLEHGRPPTARDLMLRFGLASPLGVQSHLAALQRKGYLGPTRDAPPTARAIRLVGARLALEYEDTEEGRRLRAAVEGEC